MGIRHVVYRKLEFSVCPVRIEQGICTVNTFHILFQQSSIKNSIKMLKDVGMEVPEIRETRTVPLQHDGIATNV